MLQRLVKREGDRVTQWGFLVNRGQRPWASWVYTNGGALVHKDDQGLATDSAMADDATVEALQFLQDLMYKHEVSPRPDLESELGGVELFSTGRVAVMLNNPSAVNQFRAIEAFEWDVATLPIGKAERRGTGGGGTGWASGAATKSPDAAWEFLKYITTAQAQLDEVAVGATTPSRVSVVNSEAFLDPNKPPKNAKGFAQAQEYVVRDPVHVNWPEITQRIYTPNMDLLWGGTEDAADGRGAHQAGSRPALCPELRQTRYVSCSGRARFVGAQGPAESRHQSRRSSLRRTLCPPARKATGVAVFFPQKMRFGAPNREQRTQAKRDRFFHRPTALGHYRCPRQSIGVDAQLRPHGARGD